MKSIQNIIINDSNHENSGFKNRYIFKFDRDVEFTKNMKIGLQSIKIYNSSYNISQEIGNNIIGIKWFFENIDIVIPDGFYDAEDLNFHLQKRLISLGYYYFDSSNNYYPFEIVENPTEYSININYYALPMLADAGGFTRGSESWNFPTTAENNSVNYIQLTLNSILAKMLGFSTQTNFPLVRVDNFNNENDTQFASNIPPNINYINSYVIACNLIDSLYSSKNSNILASIGVDVKLGLSLQYNPPEIIYTNIKPSRYNEIIIELLDQHYQPLKYVDKKMLMVLSVLEEK
jgi:hypothetical protein